MSEEPREKTPRPVPGALWRILAKDDSREISLENEGIFDELVIDDWFHLEQMDERRWWIRVGDARIDVVVDENGRVKVSVERDVYDP
jgi:hypothetical protein